MPDPKTPDKPSLRELADELKGERDNLAGLDHPLTPPMVVLVRFMARLAEAVADEVEATGKANGRLIQNVHKNLDERLAEIERRLDVLWEAGIDGITLMDLDAKPLKPTTTDGSGG